MGNNSVARGKRFKDARTEQALLALKDGTELCALRRPTASGSGRTAAAGNATLLRTSTGHFCSDHVCSDTWGRFGTDISGKGQAASRAIPIYIYIYTLNIYIYLSLSLFRFFNSTTLPLRAPRKSSGPPSSERDESVLASPFPTFPRLDFQLRKDPNSTKLSSERNPTFSELRSKSSCFFLGV